MFYCRFHSENLAVEDRHVLLLKTLWPILNLILLILCIWVELVKNFK